MLTMQPEQALPQSGVHSEVNSLYRKPLAKFLGRYAADAVDFFLARLNQPAFFFRLMDMLRMEKEERAHPRGAVQELGEDRRRRLRVAARRRAAPDAGAQTEGLSGVGGGSDLASYNGSVSLVSVLAKHDPDWLSARPSWWTRCGRAGDRTRAPSAS